MWFPRRLAGFTNSLVVIMVLALVYVLPANVVAHGPDAILNDIQDHHKMHAHEAHGHGHESVNTKAPVSDHGTEHDPTDHAHDTAGVTAVCAVQNANRPDSWRNSMHRGLDPGLTFRMDRPPKPRSRT